MASASAGSIFVDLLLRDSNYVQGLNRARNTTKQFSGGVNTDLNKTKAAFDGVLSPVQNISGAIAGLGSVVAGALSVREIARYSDTWKQLEGRLNLVATSSEELEETQRRLFEIAQDTRSDLGATVTLYQRLTSAVKGLGISQEEIYKFTEQLNKQLITAGLSSNEAAASIYQLTQAFNKGKLDGDEFRTLLESAPPILEALEKSLGVTRGEILKLSADGKLAPRVLVDAVNQMSAVTDERFAKFGLTIGQAFTQLDNAFLEFIGTSEEVNAGTSSVALAISTLADNLDVAAKVVITLSGLYVARLIPGLVASAAGFANNTTQTLATNAASIALQRTIATESAALANNTRITAAAAAANTTLATSMNAVTSSATVVTANMIAATNTAGRFTTGLRAVGAGIIGAFGGPVSASIIAVTAAISYLATTQTTAEEATALYADQLDRLREAGLLASQQFTKTSESVENFASPEKWRTLDDLSDKLKEAEENARQLQLQLEAGATGIANAFREIGLFFTDNEAFVAFQNLKQEFKDTGDVEAYAAAINDLANQYPDFAKIADTILQQADALQAATKAAEEYNGKIGSVTSGVPIPGRKPPVPVGFGASSTPLGGGGSDSAAKKRERELLSNLEKYQYLINGVSKDLQTYRDKEKEINDLYKAKKISLDEYTTALMGLDEEYDKTLEKSAQFSLDLEAVNKKAAESIQESFADFLFDPFADGLDGMLEGFAKTLQRMVADAAAAQILRGLFGKDGINLFPTQDGGGGGFFSDLFSGFFADGGFIPPGKWGIAGEAGPEPVFGGNTGATVIPNGGGGSGFTVNIINNSNAQISQRPGTSGASLDVIIDEAVASHISTPGSRTNQALGAYNGRSMVRR